MPLHHSEDAYLLKKATDAGESVANLSPRYVTTVLGMTLKGRPIFMPAILPQLTEGAFRVYEPFIHRAVESWPGETTFVRSEFPPGVHSHNTFAARLRDAVLSLQRFKWTTRIDVLKLNAMRAKVVVSFDERGNVVWREKKAQGRPAGVSPLDRGVGTQPPAAPTVNPPWIDPTEDEVRALCLLLDRQRLVGPIFIVGALPDETITSLSNEFAVSVSYDPVANRTIIT